MPVQESPLNWRWLHQILGNMSWTKVWTASLGAKLSLHINTFFKENALEQRVLVTQHQALISRVPVGRLKVGEVLLMGANGLLQLLDVLGSPFSESRLSLPVSLLPFFRGRIDRFATSFPFRLLILLRRGRSRGLCLWA